MATHLTISPISLSLSLLLFLLGACKVEKVDVESIPCTIVNMDFFKKLFTQGKLFRNYFKTEENELIAGIDLYSLYCTILICHHRYASNE